MSSNSTRPASKFGGQGSFRQGKDQRDYFQGNDGSSAATNSGQQSPDAAFITAKKGSSPNGPTKGPRSTTGALEPKKDIQDPVADTDEHSNANSVLAVASSGVTSAAGSQDQAAENIDVAKKDSASNLPSLNLQKISEVLKISTINRELKEELVVATLLIKEESAQKFCYQDRSTASEDLLLDDYLRHLNEPDASTLGTIKKLGSDKNPIEEEPKPPLPRKVYVTTPSSDVSTQKAIADLLSASSFAVKLFQWEAKPGEEAMSGDVISQGTIMSSQFAKIVPPSKLPLTDLRKMLSRHTSMSSSSKIHRFCTSGGTTVLDETATFSEYLRLEDTEPKDSTGLPSVNVYYKLASFLNQPKVDMTNMPGAYKEDMSKLSDDLSKDEKKADAPNLGKTRAALFDEAGWTPTAGSTEKDSAGFLTEDQWKVVLQNCGLMHGWIIDRDKHQIIQAPRPAFQLRTQKLLGQDISDNPAANQASLNGASTEAAPIMAKVEAPAPEDTSIPGVPRFKVNDNSHVEVTLSSHEFETSMARNDFSSQSTEGSVSGGYAGFSATVSAGYSNSESEGSKTTNNTYKKTMIASYLFPRADIYLNPEDLEPTAELKAAIFNIAKYKNIKDLRKLYRDFGQVFCKQVTLGGRLQSTKVITDTTTKTEQEHKEQFKVSVGVQVSTPIGVGAGVKHEREKGNSSSNSDANNNQSETNVFEAVGGDTILVSNPLLWIPTVANFWNWRVISREALNPLVDIIAGITGYANIRNYFVQAVPVLSKYIELSDGHEFKSRLRLVSNQHCLSKSHPDVTKDAESLVDPAYYLGHNPNQAVTPQYLGLADAIGNFWGDMTKYKDELPMFTPASFRAPVILGYRSDKEIRSATCYSQEFLSTAWSMTAPFNDSLQHGCRVTLTTVPLETTMIQPPSSLTVFRNQQGVFLPGMSSSDSPQYWRILKVGATRTGENIREGDTVRLCWAFADQVTGFRDFFNDIYGRRRNHCPPELESAVLYPKLPWPRFEDIKGGDKDGDGSNAMIMSTETSTDDTWTEIISRPQLARNERGSSMYLLQDVSFRIDPVSTDNGQKGDTGDYLLAGLNTNGNADVKDVLAKQRERQQKLMESILFLDPKGR